MPRDIISVLLWAYCCLMAYSHQPAGYILFVHPSCRAMKKLPCIRGMQKELKRGNAGGYKDIRSCALPCVYPSPVLFLRCIPARMALCVSLLYLLYSSPVSPFLLCGLLYYVRDSSHRSTDFACEFCCTAKDPCISAGALPCDVYYAKHLMRSVCTAAFAALYPPCICLCV